MKAVRFLTRGSPVNASWPYDPTTGLVNADPATLAAEASVDVDTFALAVMLSSEEGNSAQNIKEAVGAACMNYAKGVGKTVSALLLTAKTAGHSGFFGAQADQTRFVTSTLSGKQVHPSDRYASSRKSPYEDDIGIATALTTGATPDPTGGADQYDRPGHELNADAIAAKRTAAGKVLASVDGIDPTEIRFWKVG
jgi:hypothetical protein